MTDLEREILDWFFSQIESDPDFQAEKSLKEIVESILARLAGTREGDEQHG